MVWGSDVGSSDLVDVDVPGPDEGHRGVSVGEGVALVLLVAGELLGVERAPEVGDGRAVLIVEGRRAVFDQLRAAGLRRLQRVEVEPRLEELARGCGVDRVRGGAGLLPTEGGLHEIVVSPNARGLRFRPGPCA